MGREGADHIDRAISLGVIRHSELSLTDNPWYTSVPTLLPLTKKEVDLINLHSELDKSYSPSKGGTNIFVDVIVEGGDAFASGGDEKCAKKARSEMGGDDYLEIVRNAWNRLLACYEQGEE